MHPPEPLPKAVKARGQAGGIPYQRFVHVALKKRLPSASPKETSASVTANCVPCEPQRTGATGWARSAGALSTTICRARASRSPPDALPGHVNCPRIEHRKLAGIAEIDRPREPGRAVHQTHEAVD